MADVQLILASTSPRRRELLAQISINYRVQTVEVDETPYSDETPQQLVQRLAQRKAEAVWQVRQATAHELTDLPVLGADTVGLLEGKLLVKPVDFADAFTMLKNMSGRWHDIFTAVALTTRRGTTVALSHSRVKFRSVTDEDILAYWQTGEPQDKAGAYGIQGLGAVLVERLEGSYSGVMGLPLFETAQLLTAAGIKVL